MEHEVSDEPFDQETEELEAFLSELKDDGADLALPEELSEGGCRDSQHHDRSETNLRPVNEAEEAC